MFAECQDFDLWVFLAVDAVPLSVTAELVIKRKTEYPVHLLGKKAVVSRK